MITLTDVVHNLHKVEVSYKWSDIHGYMIHCFDSRVWVTAKSLVEGPKGFKIKIMSTFNQRLYVEDRAEWDLFVDWILNMCREGVEKWVIQ